MELHQLRYFCAIAETGSSSRAAQQTHASHPSLSQQIAKLKNELGTRLFDRLGRSVRLTETGKTLSSEGGRGAARSGIGAERHRREEDSSRKTEFAL